MTKYLTILAIFLACALQSTAATLNTRERKVRRLSEIDQTQESIRDYRQWKEEDYEAIMSIMSGGQRNLRQRQLQHTEDGRYQKKPYYTRTQTIVTKGQKIALYFFAMLTAALAIYVCALKRELSTLNQYLPLGYKLFPDTDASEEQVRPTDGVEMS